MDVSHSVGCVRRNPKIGENTKNVFPLFLEASGKPLPEHSQNKSASALSRFLNVYTMSQYPP